MSIATVVTRGYGSFGSIADVVTRGYLADADAAPTTGAGAFTDAEILAHKLRQRRLLASLPASKRSVEEAQLLVALARQLRQLQQLPPLRDEPEVDDNLEEAIEKALEAPQRPKIDMEMSAPWLANEQPSLPSLRGEIEQIQRTLKRMTRMRQEAEDDDDLEAIMLLLH